MAEILDFILIVGGIACYAALLLYKLVLWFRYRDDPAKREALISSNQVFPERLRRFIYDEDADKVGEASVSSSRLK